MKTITLLLFSSILCFGLKVQAQTETSIVTLLDRLSENHMGSVTEVFTNIELETLQNYFYQNSTVNQNSRFQLNRRISTTQSGPVAVISAADINPVDLSSIEDILPSPLNEFEGAGTVRLVNGRRVHIVDNSNKIWIRGIETGEYTNLGTINAPAGESITGLEYTSGGVLFGVSTNGVNSSTLLLIDSDTWVATPIGNSNSLVLPIALGRDMNNNLYTVDIDDDNLYKFDKTNGSTTLIGPIGFDANFGQGMTYDPYIDKLYMTAFNNDLFDSELREFNITTGMSTSLGIIVPGILMQFGWAGMYDKDELGTEDNTLKDFSFYPNPANNKIVLESKYNIETVEIYSILGQKVISKKIGATNYELDITQLYSGNYIIRLISNDKTGIYKLIKY